MMFSALLSRKRSTSSASSKSLSPAGLSNKTASSTTTVAVSPDAVALAARSSSLMSKTTPAPPEYIANESQLRPVEDDPPDLRDLNACLEALAAVFPDVQIEVFREMLGSFDGESRLAVVADALLKNRVQWVKGRWRVPVDDKSTQNNILKASANNGKASISPEEKLPRAEKAKGTSEAGTAPRVPRAEAFRSIAYKKAVQSLAWHEFKGLSKSTISAVLAEHNHAYLSARRELVQLSQKSWRFTISSLFLGRAKPTDDTAKENHPLVSWRSTGKGSIEPTLKTTGNAELDTELFSALVAPLRVAERQKQLARDREVAALLNESEAEQSNSLFECACCFGDVTFEELVTCSSSENHFLCHRCIRHTVTEAVCGQGWRASIDEEHGTLRCPAAGACEGRIPSDQLQRAVLTQSDGSSLLRRLDRRLADQSLVTSGLPLIHCPFCDYAEVDDLYIPDESQLRVSYYVVLIILIPLLLIFTFPMLAPISLLMLAACLVNTPVPSSSCITKDSHIAQLAALNPLNPKDMLPYLYLSCQLAKARLLLRRRGQRFLCQSPSCRRASCLSCHKAWVDPHRCHESLLTSLRTRVEMAMSLAIKRVCPRCNTSFVKSSGCNKLVCTCGYTMCYVCRADLGRVGYQHFCDHFRPEGDGRACDQCDKCNLWEKEDEARVLQRAKEDAEREWREQEGKELTESEERRIVMQGGSNGIVGKGGSVVDVLGVGRRPISDGVDALLDKMARMEIPSVHEVCDALVDVAYL